MTINSALTRRFQRNLMRKLAADGPFKPIPPEPIPPGYTLDAGGKVVPTLERAVGQNFPWSPYFKDPITGTSRFDENEKEKIRFRDSLISSGISPENADKIVEEAPKFLKRQERIKAIKETLKAYSPYVGGGAALGALLGGGIGYGTSGKTGGTLLGAGLGALGGAGAGGLGKYLYDRYSKK